MMSLSSIVIRDSWKESVGKVYIFWEGNKILRDLHCRFDRYYMEKSTVEISQKFEAFSEYMNFKG